MFWHARRVHGTSPWAAPARLADGAAPGAAMSYAWSIAMSRVPALTTSRRDRRLTIICGFWCPRPGLFEDDEALDRHRRQYHAARTR